VGPEALLVMDVQNAIVDRFASSRPEYLKSLSKAIEAARSAGRLVVYVRVAFREGYPEVSSLNKTFSALAAGSDFSETSASTQIHDAIAPLEGDVVVVKRRVGAFSGSDLDVLLRARGITSLVLTGIATSGCVLSTLRHAADLDFQVTVLDDLCLDADEEVHQVLMTKVFPRQAAVCSSEIWISMLG